jgi:hypothetical protein
MHREGTRGRVEKVERVTPETEGTMRRTRFYSLIPILAVATTAGCIGRGRSGGPAASVEPITTARVTNNHWLDVRLYGVRAGSREVIGIVKSFGTEVFQLPRHLVETRAVQILVDPIGSPQSYLTDVITVTPGQRIDLVIQDRLQQSHYSVVDP